MVFEHKHSAKRCCFLQASWAVPPFLASLEQKRNAFCESWNAECNRITYQILQITVNYPVASRFYPFRNIYSHYLLGKLRNYQKKKNFTKAAQISKLELTISTFPSQLKKGGEQLFWGTARGVLFNYTTRLLYQQKQTNTFIIARNAPKSAASLLVNVSRTILRSTACSGLFLSVLFPSLLYGAVIWPSRRISHGTIYRK